MVINVRGTSGSGKSTIVRGIMEKGQVGPIGEGRKPDGYIVQIPELVRPVYVVGPYVTACGGCDAISTQDEICARIRAYSTLGDVLVEGLLMSHSFARYVALDRELFARDGTHCIWAFLDTPLSLCLDRVRARREERRLATGGEFKELNTKNTTDKHRDNFEVYEKFLKARSSDWKLVGKFGYSGPPIRLDARMIDHTQAIEQVFSWLSSDGIR
jgi:hypothetical protein